MLPSGQHSLHTISLSLRRALALEPSISVPTFIDGKVQVVTVIQVVHKGMNYGKREWTDGE